ncbi:serine protease inhibitor 42Dd-like isoform X2 [Uranotaenia lowii]|uniref:serine protease inhibitor 42Dd-like isoform X2 n=1 Tax=Uranotaenia lowii TaxID=190385 RepID=UPI0024797588|nr:serine protease inhibitor 42Dd-like isoform X2 [Uranotaenia lowii]
MKPKPASTVHRGESPGKRQVKLRPRFFTAFSVGLSILVAIAAWYYLSVLKSSTIPVQHKMEQLDAQFVQRTNHFALELYKQIIQAQKGNVVISPFSISSCLSFAGMGAAGPTAEEMFASLKHGSASERHGVADNYGKILRNLVDNNSLKIANKMYIMDKYSLKSSFHEIATKSFHSEAESVNFGDSATAAQTINNWVEGKTNNKIKELISPEALDDLTRMVLVNAIHFKGTWTHQFNPDKTVPRPFWTSETESVDVPMMNIKKQFNYGLFDELNMAALELTYSDSEVSMLILLPHERDGLAKLEENLLNINFDDIRSKMYNQEVEVFLPKFKIEFDLDLKETLEKLGMVTMFTDQADFSGLLEQPEPLKVSKVIHKAFIEINEEGAEAAAATGMIMMTRCLILHPYFTADHPFLYMLQQNGQIYFVGRKTEA